MDWSYAVQVNDPDPTPWLEDENVCPAYNGTFFCTREEVHSGRHIAGDGIDVCAVWA